MTKPSAGDIILFLISASVTYTFPASYKQLIASFEAGGIPYKDFSNLGLHDMPQDIPRKTEVLLLQNNIIASITDQFWTSDCGENTSSTSCSRLPNLKLLDISHNQIENISLYCFHGLVQLTILLLPDNKLREINRETFLNNNRLKFIDISRNRIISLQPKIFQNLINLELLDLGNNLISNVHEDAFLGLHSLTKLRISNNYIFDIHPNVFRDLKILKHLDINHNRLTGISEFIFQHLENLKFFAAANNKICSLSPTFFSLAKNIQVVDFSGNSLRNLSRYIFQEIEQMVDANFAFNNLEYVYLSRIPVSLKKLQSTYILDTDTGLCTNSEEDIPCFIPANNLKTLKIFHSLDYSFNNIQELIFIKNGSTYMLELVNLTLAGNPKLNIPITFIRKEKFIVELDLNQTNLSWRNMTLFNQIFQLHHLKTFKISGCDACEYYTLQILSSVFNPNNRIHIACDEIRVRNLISSTNDADLHSHRRSEYLSLANNTTDVMKEDNIPAVSSYLGYYPCYIFDSETVINETFPNKHYLISCHYTVDCSYASLTTLPEIKSSASCVLLSHNDIAALKENYFLNFWDMGYLDLSFNKLNFLDGEIFKNLFNLTALKMNNNALVHLNASTFKSLTSLRLLTLHGNKISSYDPNTLANMWQLNLLSIEFWNLERFHDETFEELSSLRLLEIRIMSNMSFFKHALNSVHFKSLHNLETCKLIGFMVNTSSIGDLFNSNVLSGIIFEDSLLPMFTRKDFEKIKNVENIVLIRNNITDLQECFRDLSGIAYVDVSNNEIQVLHNNVFQSARQLDFLNMSHNQISFLPLRIFDSLSALLFLDLSYNVISTLPVLIFSQLSNIQQIYLAGNLMRMSIEHDHTASYNCSSLYTNAHFNTSEHLSSNDSAIKSTSICLSNNSTEHYLSSNHFSNNSFLKYLSLERNCITSLTAHTFRGTPLIRFVDLAHNNISKIDDETFTSTPFLKYLNLSCNSLPLVSNNLFKNLTHLLFLDLTNNKLELIEGRAFRNLHSLIYLGLGYNSLKTFEFNSLSKENQLGELRLNNNLIASLETTIYLPALAHLQLSNNPLNNDAVGIFFYMPSLSVLTVANTTICETHKYLFGRLNNLLYLKWTNGCLRGLSCSHFANLQVLIVLEVQFEGRGQRPVDTYLSWKNLTLINCWFEMVELQYLVLVGHPICEDLQRVQLIENLFLSNNWKNVICSAEPGLPRLITSRDGTKYVAQSTTKTYFEYM